MNHGTVLYETGVRVFVVLRQHDDVKSEVLKDGTIIVVLFPRSCDVYRAMQRVA